MDATHNTGGRNMAETLYRGDCIEGPVEVGQCWTPSREIADGYAGDGVVYSAELDENAVRVVTLDAGYDRETNVSPGDTAEDRARLAATADVIVYSDEDEDGRTHTTYRLLTEAAVAAMADVAIVEEQGW